MAFVKKHFRGGVACGFLERSIKKTGRKYIYLSKLVRIALRRAQTEDFFGFLGKWSFSRKIGFFRKILV